MMHSPRPPAGDSGSALPAASIAVRRASAACRHEAGREWQTRCMVDGAADDDSQTFPQHSRQTLRGDPTPVFPATAPEAQAPLFLQLQPARGRVAAGVRMSTLPPAIEERRRLQYDGRSRRHGSRRHRSRRSRRHSSRDYSSESTGSSDSDYEDRRLHDDVIEEWFTPPDGISPQCFRALPRSSVFLAAAALFPAVASTTPPCCAATCWAKAHRTYYEITSKRITRYTYKCCCCESVENVHMV
jgi:hypothetical protein